MQVDPHESALKADVASVQNIAAISTILDVICRTTGMGFAAVARVTEERWVTCGVLDHVNFGLKPGDELKVETTICHEIRQSGHQVIINDTDKSELYCQHHTPKMYGFKSYVSVPIKRNDGSFFGTLCAIDSKPANVNTPEVIGMFNLFADLISFHLSASEQLKLSEVMLLEEKEERARDFEKKNYELQKINIELESFAYVASHDLQEPLRKIETFSNFILNKDYDNLSTSGKHYMDRLMKSVKRMQTLIKDLLMYTQVKMHEQVFELTPLDKLIEELKLNYSEEITERHVTIDASSLCEAYIIPFQFKQLLQNMIGNSIKFAKPGIHPVVQISSAVEAGDRSVNEKLSPEKNFCHIIISDNGIGFDPQHKEKIFEVFQRLHGREEYGGTGIGLSIVKKIIDNHHGFISADSQVNEGARFDIYIPHHSTNR